MTASGCLRPDWSLPEGVEARLTQRHFGNLGLHVADDPNPVMARRRSLTQAMGSVSPHQIGWLAQTHSTQSVRLQPRALGEEASKDWVEADASWTSHPALACVVLTADCVPILLCDDQATVVGAVHAGWRGLAHGVLASLFGQWPALAEKTRAWIGPCIGQAAFEVGPEVQATFVDQCGWACQKFFQPGAGGRDQADLPGLVDWQLRQLGVWNITHSRACTYQDPEHFHSHRRVTQTQGPQAKTGRQASLIWLTPWLTP